MDRFAALFIWSLLVIAPRLLAAEQEAHFDGLCYAYISSDASPDVALASVENDDALTEFRLDLSKPETVLSTPSHPAKLPPFLKAYDLTIQLERPDPGWPMHEAISVTTSLIQRDAKKVVGGPFSAMIIRKIGVDFENGGQLPIGRATFDVAGHAVKLFYSCLGDFFKTVDEASTTKPGAKN